LKSLDKVSLPPQQPQLSGILGQQEGARLKELDRRVSDHAQTLDKLQAKVHAAEKLAYEVRRDFSKGLNEVELAAGKRCEQLARAVQEVNRMVL